MPRISAGILLYRIREKALQVLLVHPGGPFFKNKDDGAWSIPKGEADAGEELLACALREYAEEIGPPPTGPYQPLSPIKQKGGKVVHTWAVAGDCDPAAIVSNTFEMEWPPRSGRRAEFPEIDRAAFFDLATAKLKINSGQAPLLDELINVLRDRELL